MIGLKTTGLGNITAGGELSAAASDIAVGAMIGGPVGAAVGAVTFAAQTIANLLNHGQDKVAATDCSNNAEFAGIANVQEWNNYPPYMKTRALQAQYLNQALEVWKYLEQCCNKPELGDAGKRCISERDRGGKYDFWPYNYDSIANDPQVFDSASSPMITAGTSVLAPTTIVNPATGGSFVNQLMNNPSLDFELLAGLGLLLLLL